MTDSFDVLTFFWILLLINFEFLIEVILYLILLLIPLVFTYVRQC